MQKRLWRSESNRVLGGVCGGLGDYLGIDPTLVRIFFVIVIFSSNIGFWVYLIAWVIIPNQGDEDESSMDKALFEKRVQSMGEDIRSLVKEPNPQAAMFVGIGLIIYGAFLLLDKLNFSWLYWWDMSYLWPIFLVIAGVFLLVKRIRE